MEPRDDIRFRPGAEAEVLLAAVGCLGELTVGDRGVVGE